MDVVLPTGLQELQLVPAVTHQRLQESPQTTTISNAQQCCNLGTGRDTRNVDLRTWHEQAARGQVGSQNTTRAGSQSAVGILEGAAACLTVRS